MERQEPNRNRRQSSARQRIDRGNYNDQRSLCLPVRLSSDLSQGCARLLSAESGKGEARMNFEAKSVLTFEPIPHVYRLDGQQIPSVTGVLQAITNFDR